MGLCKCPKRKVTNLFCFVHRVNVCEHCMVTNHPKCIIQSYLKWLQDSDCSLICTFCEENLSDRECCRLTCYHLHHWACLDSYCRNLPDSNNGAKYVCPLCNTNIIPQPNLVSPVADALREKLLTVNWARSVQGLPLLSFEREEKPEHTRSVLETSNTQSSMFENHITTTSTATSRTSSSVNSNSVSSNMHSNNQELGPPYSVVNMESSSAMSSPTPRKVFEAYDDPKDFSFDHDENKYQRKSAMEWFLRWWKLITRTPARRRMTIATLRKNCAIIIVFGIGLYILIVLLVSWLFIQPSAD